MIENQDRKQTLAIPLSSYISNSEYEGLIEKGNATERAFYANKAFNIYNVTSRLSMGQECKLVPVFSESWLRDDAIYISICALRDDYDEDYNSTLSDEDKAFSDAWAEIRIQSKYFDYPCFGSDEPFHIMPEIATALVPLRFPINDIGSEGLVEIGKSFSVLASSDCYFDVKYTANLFPTQKLEGVSKKEKRDIRNYITRKSVDPNNPHSGQIVCCVVNEDGEDVFELWMHLTPDLIHISSSGLYQMACNWYKSLVMRAHDLALIYLVL